MSSVSHIKHLLIRVFSLVPEQPKMMRLKSWMHLGLVFFFFRVSLIEGRGEKAVWTVFPQLWHVHGIITASDLRGTRAWHSITSKHVKKELFPSQFSFNHLGVILRLGLNFFNTSLILTNPLYLQRE